MCRKKINKRSVKYYEHFTIISSGKIAVIISVLMFVLCLGSANAAEFYVDPDYVGTSNGSAASPWKSLDGSATAAWSAINSALASSDVTVYFSAREAGADVDETVTKRISIRRASTSTYRLTLDGMSKYNKNDSAPLWASYSGSSRYKITGDSYSIESTFVAPKQNYVTIRGFKCIAGSGKAFSYWGGDHIIVENNEFSGTSTSAGSLVFFEYAHRVDVTDTRQNGGCTDITFRNNSVHDTTGEGIYVGGASDTGLPGHSKVTIENNTIYNTGIYGGEGDGIDIKDGNIEVIINNNVIRNGSATGIVSHSGIKAAKNVIFAMGGGGIKLNTYWGLGYKDVVMTGNLVFSNTGNGLLIYTQTASKPILNVTLDQNTVINNTGSGLAVESSPANAVSGVIIRNNITAYNATGIRVYQVSSRSISNNDVYGNKSADYSGISSQTGINGNISADPLFIDINNPSGRDGLFWTDDDGLLLGPASPANYASDIGGIIGAYLNFPLKVLLPAPRNLTIIS